MPIKELMVLNTINVEISEHTILNQVKGVIHYKNRPGHTDEELLSKLKP